MPYMLGLIVFGYYFLFLYALFILVPFALLAWLLPVIRPVLPVPALVVLLLAALRAHLAGVISATRGEGFLDAAAESGDQLWILVRSVPFLGRIARILQRKR